MASLLVLLALSAIWLGYLLVERIRLDGHRNAVPLRIAVSGTRGKTTVTRMLAAVLAEDGRKVLAKTTGSEAVYLLPDGSTREIHRLGVPSIIEQKHLLKIGARLGVDVVLAEVMSLHPENHRVEVQQILQPHLVLITNFRIDHTEAQGRSRQEVAAVLSLDVPPGARAFVPEAEWQPEFQELVAQAGGEVVRVQDGESRPPAGDSRPETGESRPPAGESRPETGGGEFRANLDLVWAAARHLGVKEDTIGRGIGAAEGDVGALRSWRYRPLLDSPGDPWLLVNAFAANDPESTMGIYERLLHTQGLGPEACVGLLSLRPDRGDRSLQWAEALEAGALSNFRTLFVAGLHARALKYRLRRHPEVEKIKILHASHPEGIMAQVVRGDADGGSLLFGFGNIAGLGRTLVDHWRKVGEPHGI